MSADHFHGIGASQCCFCFPIGMVILLKIVPKKVYNLLATITHIYIYLLWFMNIVGIKALALSCMSHMETPLNVIVLSNIVTASMKGIQNNNINALIATARRLFRRHP